MNKHVWINEKMCLLPEQKYHQCMAGLLVPPYGAMESVCNADSKSPLVVFSVITPFLFPSNSLSVAFLTFLHNSSSSSASLFLCYCNKSRYSHFCFFLGCQLTQYWLCFCSNTAIHSKSCPIKMTNSSSESDTMSRSRHSVHIVSVPSPSFFSLVT